jgi:hypothetical protein
MNQKLIALNKTSPLNLSIDSSDSLTKSNTLVSIRAYMCNIKIQQSRFISYLILFFFTNTKRLILNGSAIM